MTDFMKKKKHIEDFNMSEPEFLISILNRHNDWATIICLIGGGQEINKGESAGIYGWFDSLRNNYPNWDIYVSDKITDDEYSYKLLDELELAYAVTIHKSQGSEYPAVVIPLLSGPRMLMNRNLLYTAVTRAKKCVTIVGDDTTFEQMIENNSQQRRYSGLKDRLLENKEEA